ncbi:hypothetical protein PR048_028861 [Dryococelus australis]|uniref:Uncharacterized protein n=1 Tax=Dryococelus australis TaxID=614101 RepID=A0ABQ9GCC8_9NEOP|nr:hypothetical protein PR048_028861 [Dryococelus australis]
MKQGDSLTAGLDLSPGSLLNLAILQLRKCINNNQNSFCYVYGKLMFKTQKPSLTTIVKKCNELYFGCKLGDQEKN